MSAHCCDHGHEHASAAAASPVYRRVLWVALAVNLAMFVVEIGAGLAAQSASLLHVPSTHAPITDRKSVV